VCYEKRAILKLIYHENKKSKNHIETKQNAFVKVNTFALTKLKKKNCCQCHNVIKIIVFGLFDAIFLIFFFQL